MPGIKTPRTGYISYSRKNERYSCTCGFQTKHLHLFKLHCRTKHNIAIKDEDVNIAFGVCGYCERRNCRGH